MIDGNQIYFIKENYATLDIYELKPFEAKGYLMGKASTPPQSSNFYPTATAVSEDHIFIGTQHGLIVARKGTGKLLEGQALSQLSQYEAYPMSSRLTPSYPKLEADEVSPLQIHNEENGFPDNNILALAYHQGKLYVGTGPSKKNELGYAGKSGLSIFDVKTKNYEILASSNALTPQNPLDGGESYQISSILIDEKRQCLWISIKGNSERKGIWKYDFNSKRFQHVVKENSSIEKMIWTDKEILCYLFKSGLVLFDPDQSKVTWLMGYQSSGFTGFDRPQPPVGYQKEPLMGHPQTRLWPAVKKGHHVFTLDWNGVVNLHQEKPAAGPNSIYEIDQSYGGAVEYIGQNEYGLWIIGENGRLYLAQSRR